MNTETRDTGLGFYVTDLPTEELPADEQVLFTFFWLESKQWKNTDFAVAIPKQQ